MKIGWLKNLTKIGDKLYIKNVNSNKLNGFYKTFWDSENKRKKHKINERDKRIHFNDI